MVYIMQGYARKSAISKNKKFSHLPQTLPRFLAHNNMRFFLSWSETLDYAFIRYFKTFFFQLTLNYVKSFEISFEIYKNPLS